MFVIIGKNSDRSYAILLGIAELFGLLSVILVGLFFAKNVFDSTYNWITYPFSYHPLMMTMGLLFCYGNAIIVYRTLKQTAKYTVKILHALLLIISLVFTAVGFVAIIRSKNLGKHPHFMTYHSWMGLITISLFSLQWILGFVSFLVPQLSLDFRKAYMPSHRLWGKVIFLSAVVAILTGLSEHGMTSSYSTPNDGQRSRRLIMNFFALFVSLFALIIIYLLSNPDYQRPPEGTVQDTSLHKM